MKILHINCNYIETTLHQLLIEELDKSGIENEVFVPTYDKSKSVIQPNDNVTISECFNKWDRLAFDYKQNKILSAIKRQYDLKSFDLIHAYTLFTDGNIARKLSEKYNIPFVVAVRNTDVNIFLKKIFYLRKRGLNTLLKADSVFFLSKPCLHELLEKYTPAEYKKIVFEKSIIVPNGIDDFWHDNRYYADRFLKDEIKIIYAGKINKNKNVITTQKAMNILRQEGIDISLTIIGEIKDRKEFDKIIRDSHTAYYPAVSKDNLINFYRKSDIFVMPSYTETFGLVYAEAMTQGLPVVYSRGQGFDEQFPDGEIGKSVESNNPYCVANGIKMIINNYHEVSKNCVYKSEKFRWKKISNIYYEVYRRILDNEK